MFLVFNVTLHRSMLTTAAKSSSDVRGAVPALHGPPVLLLSLLQTILSFVKITPSFCHEEKQAPSRSGLVSVMSIEKIEMQSFSTVLQLHCPRHNLPLPGSTSWTDRHGLCQPQYC